MVKLLSVLFLLGATIMGGQAAEMSPIGQWRLNTGQSHYEISYCGNGEQLCAKVIWLGPKTLDEKTAPYLNTYLVREATSTGPHRWKGKISIFGQTLGGTVEQLSNDEIKLTGCKFIFCKSFKLYRL